MIRTDSESGKLKYISSVVIVKMRMMMGDDGKTKMKR